MIRVVESKQTEATKVTEGTIAQSSVVTSLHKFFEDYADRLEKQVVANPSKIIWEEEGASLGRILAQVMTRNLNGIGLTAKGIGRNDDVAFVRSSAYSFKKELNC